MDEYSLRTIGCGLLVMGMVLAKPWWLRNWSSAVLELAMSDSVRRVYWACQIVLGLLMGAGLVFGGAVRLNLLEHDMAVCRSLYAAARDSHERVRVLQAVPRPQIAVPLRIPFGYQPLSCAEYRTKRSF